jgi:diguanylate cyclase (GGDEF)-like protein
LDVTSVLDALPDPGAIIDRTGRIVVVNRAWRQFGIDNGAAEAATGIGVNYLDVCDRAGRNGAVDGYLAAAALRTVLSGEAVQTELEYQSSSPWIDRWSLLRVTPLAGTGSVLVTHLSITRRVVAEEALARYHAPDPLTGIANRELFTAALDAALAPRAGRISRPDVGVLCLDLIGFRDINASYGRDAGDEVLQMTAHRLLGQLRSSDTIARLDADEFAIVAPDIDLASLTALARDITESLGGLRLIHGHAVEVPAGVGFYLASRGERVGDALAQASEHRHRVKRAAQLPNADIADS